MYIFISILIVLASLLLIGVVLIQKSKGGGLASDYSGGNQYLGYRKTTDFIEKTTWTLAIIICVLSIACSFTLKKPAAQVAVTSPAQEKAAPAPGTQANTTPAAAAAAPTATATATETASETDAAPAPAPAAQE